MSSWWWRFLLFGVLLAAGQQLLPNGLGSSVVYSGIGALSVAAMVVGVRRNHPTNRRAWIVLAAGNGAWLLGDTIYNWDTHVLGQAAAAYAHPPFIAAYVLLAAGLVLLVRSRDPGFHPKGLLDTAILITGLGLGSWVLLVIPAWVANDVPTSVLMIGAVYLLADVLLVAIGIRLMAGPGFWNASSRLLFGSLLVFAITHGLHQGAQFDPSIASNIRALDPGWLLAYVLWGAAALHPSMRTVSAPAPEREDTILVGRLLVVCVAAMAGPVIVAAQTVAGMPLHPWPIVIGSTVLVGLVLLRMVRMVNRLRNQSDRLTTLAHTDFITGLANRRGFAERLELHLTRPNPCDGRIALVGVERFSELTSTLGQDTGDAILHAVGERLGTLCSAGDLVARIGDDTVAIFTLAPTVDHHQRALNLREALERPYQLPELNVAVEISLGIVSVPDDAVTPALALHRAGVALVRAKTRPGRIARYTPDMERCGPLATQLAGELRAALLHDEIVLHYQPQVEISTGRVFGVEALARWQHPTRGLLAPDTFIPAAEQTGLIGPFTHYVLDHALDQCAQWRRDGLDLTVAVNLSVRNLLDPGLIEDVRASLRRHALAPSSLELEITEGTAMADPTRSLQVLGVLADMGITLSIDDYGTGHSSLAYLQRLPVKRLKIDRFFVTDMNENEPGATIVRSTIDLARHLDLDVIAEGVEDEATLLALRDMQCYAAQGFGLGRPVEAHRLPALVRAIEERLPAVVGAPTLLVRG